MSDQWGFGPGNSPGIFSVVGHTIDQIRLLIEIGGLSPGSGTDGGYDQINVTGLASLGGTLEIQLINGFIPTIGDTFQILNYESVSGQFNTINGLDLGGGVYLVPVQGPSGLELITTTVAMAGSISILLTTAFNGIKSFFSTDSAGNSVNYNGSITVEGQNF